MNNLYPIVVPASYFVLPKEAAHWDPGNLDAFGIIRPLGNDLFSLLVQINGDVLKNVHEQDLPTFNLDRAGAEQTAIANLSAFAKSSNAITRQVSKTPSRFHFSVWFGDRLTSSCILWPGLYEWAKRELETDQLLVSAPQVQLMCVAARGNPEFRDAIKGYMKNVVKDMDQQISTEWFELSSTGITPMREAP